MRYALLAMILCGLTALTGCSQKHSKAKRQPVYHLPRISDDLAYFLGEQSMEDECMHDLPHCPPVD